MALKVSLFLQGCGLSQGFFGLANYLDHCPVFMETLFLLLRKVPLERGLLASLNLQGYRDTNSDCFLDFLDVKWIELSYLSNLAVQPCEFRYHGMPSFGVDEKVLQEDVVCSRAESAVHEQICMAEPGINFLRLHQISKVKFGFKVFYPMATFELLHKFRELLLSGSAELKLGRAVVHDLNQPHLLVSENFLVRGQKVFKGL